jgi:predicted MFS family arabinose efflux permease
VGVADPAGRTAAARPVRATLAAVGINLAGVLPLFLTGGMAVQIGRDLGFGPAGVGVLAACYAGSAMLGSAPLGGRVGTLGVRRSLRWAAVVAAVALAGAALAPSAWWLGAALIVAGSANAIGQPAGNATVAQHVAASRFGLAFAVKQSGIPLATLLAGLAVPAVALTVGWRYGYAAAAALAAATVLLPPPDRAAEQRRSEGRVPGERAAPLWGLAAALSLAVVAATSIGAFGASGGVAIGLSEGSAGLLIAAGGLAGLTVRLGAGVLADRIRLRALVAVAVLMCAGAIGWAAMATAFLVASTAPYVLGLLIANAFGWGWPGLLHLAVARLFPTATAAASGVTQTGVSAGLLLGPLLLGAAIGAWGWGAAWSITATAAVAAAALTLAVRGRLGEA